MINQWLHEALYSMEINTTTATFRLVFSLIVGGIIGLERRWRQQPAGFRTHILICLAATLLMMLSIYIPQQYEDFKNGDPGRIAAQIITGVGFLGAGAIIKIGSNIRGLTTAASIWLISAIGMGIGAGLYLISGIVAFLMLFILIVLERFEKRIIPDYTTRILSVITESRTVSSDKILSILKHYPLSVVNVDIHHSFSKVTTEMNFTISFKNNLPIDNIIDAIGEIEQVKMVNLL
ncbi:MAG: MgtC/SapB family protein [Bacteroidales bacterium]|jgi:putative Mg2+ transporter-C (MgtC) family protein|nr:MgtC/SapB family protein [Bacteroidales bacterium]